MPRQLSRWTPRPGQRTTSSERKGKASTHLPRDDVQALARLSGKVVTLLRARTFVTWAPLGVICCTDVISSATARPRDLHRYTCNIPKYGWSFDTPSTPQTCPEPPLLQDLLLIHCSGYFSVHIASLWHKRHTHQPDLCLSRTT
jgi:hypothetical protein